VILGLHNLGKCNMQDTYRILHATIMDNKLLEMRIREIGLPIFEEASQSGVSFFSARYWSDKMMELLVKDEKLQKAALSLAAVIPVLTRTQDVVTHVEEYLTPVADRLPVFLRWGIYRQPLFVMDVVKAAIIRWQMNGMAKRFILGETLESAISYLKAIRRRGMPFTLNSLGESVISEEEAIEHLEQYLHWIELMHRSFKNTKEGQPIIPGHGMERSPTHLSIKLTGIYPNLDPIKREKAMPVLIERLSAILAKAKECDCYITVDMEDYALKDLTLEVIEKTFCQKEFADFDKIGVVMQSYLRDTEVDLRAMQKWVKARGAPITVRLVKGAYWDMENKLASSNGWRVPVWAQKRESDQAFERNTRFLFDNADCFVPEFASHNIRSLSHAVAYAELAGVDKTRFELAGLYGMADPIKQAFVRRGYLVREYTPVGALLPGMAYFVRRLLENTSNQGFLRLKFYEHESAETLLAQP
jgi:RHH-type proline utilization regulon transcriptional repressor/proline dehydrogenase/delta 1-pyrroline-5-carboxylate dehydrogenase